MEKEVVIALISGGVAIIVALIGFLAKRSSTPTPSEQVKEESKTPPSSSTSSSTPSIQQENSGENAVQIGTVGGNVSIGGAKSAGE